MNTEAIEHLRKVQDRGAAVVLATGNVLPVALAIHRSIGLTGPIVAENGGLVYRKVEGRDVVERLARRSVALAAYRTLRARGIPVRRPVLRPVARDRGRPRTARPAPGDPRGARRDRRDRGIDRLSPIHLMERGAGKRTGLARALGPLGLSLAECFVAGDGDNDVAMLRAAGFGASFPNGSARARAAATFVSRRPYAEGFVEALMRSGLVPRSRPVGSPPDAGQYLSTVRSAGDPPLRVLRPDVLPRLPRRRREDVPGLRGDAEIREGTGRRPPPALAEDWRAVVGSGSSVDTYVVPGRWRGPDFANWLTHIRAIPKTPVNAPRRRTAQAYGPRVG